jgi:hypothetical protein
MNINALSWLKILETGRERLIDPIEEASTGTDLVPSWDREWLSEDELPPVATTDDTGQDMPSQSIDLPVLPEPPPIPSSPEGEVVPSLVDEQDCPRGSDIFLRGRYWKRIRL